MVVNIIWGLKEQDRRECHHTDFKCKGKTVFDRSFDMNTPPCQTEMLVSLILTKLVDLAGNISWSTETHHQLFARQSY